MTASELQKWQQRHGLSQVAAAKALGMPSVQTYRNWVHGLYPVSPIAERLTKYIDDFGLIEVKSPQEKG